MKCKRMIPVERGRRVGLKIYELQDEETDLRGTYIHFYESISALQTHSFLHAHDPCSVRLAINCHECHDRLDLILQIFYRYR